MWCRADPDLHAVDSTERQLDLRSAEFETALTHLRQATEDHTQRVEAEEFPLLTDR
ncbi:hypothetical protein MAUB_07790 [Mycolicibacterium aubagnense]|uniref:Uncharacterized protein n=1 Tax=Mycolicibacterium aubagnense TaxID=319707 RepID=A0ABM7I8J1_9MYCO|nr:hypothetical protein MAUB_07790 [Mycolicibacterium aubagnense]